jgi:hypothetical protein
VGVVFECLFPFFSDLGFDGLAFGSGQGGLTTGRPVIFQGYLQPSARTWTPIL